MASDAEQDSKKQTPKKARKSRLFGSPQSVDLLDDFLDDIGVR